MDARINPTQKGPRVSIASIGRPSSGSKSAPLKTTLLASPIMTMMRRKGVCHAKNHNIALFLSLSVPSVITRLTTCGCPATLRPPKKNAKAQRVNPNPKSAGTILVRLAFCSSRPECRPPKPPTSPMATQHSREEPTIITLD